MVTEERVGGFVKVRLMGGGSFGTVLKIKIVFTNYRQCLKLE